MSIPCNLEFTASWPWVSFDLKYSWFALVHLRRGSLPQLFNINSEWKCHQHLSFKLWWTHYTADFIAPSAEQERKGIALNTPQLCQEALSAPTAWSSSFQEQKFSPLSLQCHAWPDSLGQCWENARVTSVWELHHSAVAHTTCWETGSDLCFLKLLFKYFEQSCSGGNSSRSWLLPQSAHKHSLATVGHKMSRFVLPPPRVEKTPWLFLLFPLQRAQCFAIMCVSQKKIDSWYNY